MNSLILRIFFHGLIAFVPNIDLEQGPDLMTAYLVKDDHHHSTLSFEMTKASMCPEIEMDGGTVCRKENDSNPWCVCHLEGDVNISFGSDTAHPRRNLESKPGKGKLD